MTVPIWRVLGQLIPAAATPGNLYTVAPGRQGVVETLLVCNQEAAGATIKVSVRRAGLGPFSEQYLYYVFAVTANNTHVHASPIRLFTLDQLWVESSSGLVSFNAFGQEEFV